MQWTGRWQNQYGSIVTVERAENGKIEGQFRTAIETSVFFGETVPLTGMYTGNAISVMAARDHDGMGHIAAFTGLFTGEHIEMLWYVVSTHRLSASKEGAPARKHSTIMENAIATGADIFKRISD